MAFRPSRAQTAPVVPEPHIGSSTRSPGAVVISMSRSNTRSGFCAGWPVCSALPTKPMINGSSITDGGPGR
jgi:hypothetical protein